MRAGEVNAGEPGAEEMRAWEVRANSLETELKKEGSARCDDMSSTFPLPHEKAEFPISDPTKLANF